jgi:hypothetical protein
MVHKLIIETITISIILENHYLARQDSDFLYYSLLFIVVILKLGYEGKFPFLSNFGYL